MNYSFYLFSKLFDLKFKMDFEYDIMFEIVSYWYEKYTNSRNNDSGKSEYVCMINFLNENVELISADIADIEE